MISIKLGVDFFCKELKSKRDSKENGMSRKNLINYINLWDTSGSEHETKVLPQNLYKNANGYIICSSYDSLSSLLNLKIWFAFLNKFLNSKTPAPIFIVFNKFDLPPKLKKFGMVEIKFHLKEILDKSLSKVKIFNEVSAKENLNVDSVFERIGEILCGISNVLPFIKNAENFENRKNSNRELNLEDEKKIKKSFSLISKNSNLIEKSKRKNKCCE